MKKGLDIRNVEIFHNGERLVALNAFIEPGEILTLMGPSGVGKSTLIKAVAGFLPPDFTCTGQILLNGDAITPLPPERRHVGILFQDPLLFPHFSVAENILFALPPGGTRKQRLERVRALLEPVGLSGLMQRDPATLSGGQQARVALMRVIAAAPCALLLDEPFSRLDTELREAVRQFVFSIIASRKLPALLVTHDQEDTSASGLVLNL